jgi:ribosome-binding ATPase YchF (GTP1/OBG family)
MRVGIVGFAGSGKSTLFELLTGTRPDPAKIHAGQVGVATLSDPRLDFLASLHKPKKVTAATVEFLDTPGLLSGSHADNPQRLALIREGDALLIVLNGFAGDDPAAQLAAFREELLFADLSVVTSRAERLEVSIKKARPDREQAQKELTIIKRVLETLEEGKYVATLGLSDDDKNLCARSDF